MLQDIMQELNHLKAVSMDGTDKKDNLLINIIPERSECTRIKKKNAIRIKTPGEPITEYIAFGCMIISTRKEKDLARCC